MAGTHETTYRIASNAVAIDTLDRTLDEAMRVLEQIAGLYQILAAQPDPGGAMEAQLTELIEVRTRLSTDIGHAAIQILSTGGSIRAIPGALTSSPRTETVTVPLPETTVRRAAAPLAAVKQRSAPSRWQARAPTDEERRALLAHASTIGMPDVIESRDQAAEAARRLTTAVTEMDAWLDHPQDGQKALMGLASSLARQIQDEAGFPLSYVDDEALRGAFSRMTAWSREHRPGFVPGLSRSNSPDHGSWLADGRHWWSEIHRGQPPENMPGTPEFALTQLRKSLRRGVEDRKSFAAQVRAVVDAGLEQDDPRLVEILTPFQSTLHGARGLKTLKTVLRDALKAEEDAEEAATQEDPSPIPDDWPLRTLCVGKRAVMVGGDPRPKALERVESAFAFAEAEWEETNMRRVVAVAERVQNDLVDLVILLRQYTSGAILDILRPACTQAHVPLCLVETGYGVAEIKVAMERSFGTPDHG